MKSERMKSIFFHSSLFTLHLYHSPCFKLQIFIDALEGEVLGSGEYTLNPVTGQFLNNKAFLKGEFLGDNLVIHLLDMLGRLTQKLFQFCILEEDHH